MCGIAGVWGETDETTVREMMGRLAHRGPDAEGLYANGGGAVGHRRLSIMDPSGGNQPIHNEEGTLAIVANGEVYNYPTLREKLSGRHTFRTGNDSEGALHLYEELQAATVNHLDGMFALAIAGDRDIFLARDPIGIKPLYYAFDADDDRMIFASELKALAGLAGDVKEFPPGTLYHSQLGFRSYYTVPQRAPRTLPPQAHIDRLRATLERAVEKRLMSDVPVGAFLSGGLDSSILAALMRRHVDGMHTFSVGVEGSPDLAAARLVAQHLDTRHHEYVMTPDEISAALTDVIYHLESFDQDLVRSAVPCYFVSRLAAEHVKVVLTGEGADELFAGYSYYRDIRDPQTLHRELRRSVGALHNINLQRVDRLTMAQSIEGRVPFLDLEMIDVAETIPPELKLRRGSDGERWEKWVLRVACQDLLPQEIVWRDKAQFDEGSGTIDVLDSTLERWLSVEEAKAYTDAHPDAGLRSREECVYHKLLTERYDDATAILDNVGRWTSGRAHETSGNDG